MVFDTILTNGKRYKQSRPISYRKLLTDVACVMLLRKRFVVLSFILEIYSGVSGPKLITKNLQHPRKSQDNVVFG